VSAKYFVEIFHGAQDVRIDELTEAIRDEVLSLGVHHSVEVSVTTAPTQVSPAVGVYLGSQTAVADPGLESQLTVALSSGRVVIPVVDSLANFSSLVPSILTPLNGWEWSGATPAIRLARRLLEELGIEDRRRRVFISHKRDDGLAAAEQLYDCLAHNGFVPFIDRFGIGIGHNVQNDIADALEDCAFLLLIETPLASSSDWVFDEVEYAQSHQMGMHIVTWPGDVPEIPATNRLPRQILGADDLATEKGYEIFTDSALDKIVAEVEAIHANALVRRRRYLLRSAEDAAHASGLKCTPMEGWRLMVESSSERSIVQVSARLPTVEDLHELDQVRSKETSVDMPGVLVHSARLLRADRHAMLSWAVGMRNLTLVPENAVGGYWS
jgi:TIR domain